MKYSLRQINGFIKLANLYQSEDERAMAILIRMSYHADSPAFKKFIKALEE